MAKKKAKKKDKKKGKKDKKSKKEKKSKDPKPAAAAAPPPQTQQPPLTQGPPLGLGYVWTMEDDFLTGQIFEHFSQGKGTMNANEFGRALKSMGFGQPALQPRQVFPPINQYGQQQQPQTNNNNNVLDSFSSSSNINNDMFQNGYMSLTPWWITNDRLVGNKYHGADLAIAEARRRRKFSERAMDELTVMRR